MDKEEVPCVWCTARALAHTVDDYQFAAPTQELRQALQNLMAAMYAVQDELHWPYPEDVPRRWLSHLRYQVRSCRHKGPGSVDNPLDDPPF